VSKARITGAEVTITNLDTGVSRHTKSNHAGEFIFSTLPIGRYTVSVAASGFESYSVPEMTLSQGDRARVEASLVVGSEQVVVEVTASPEIQTDSSVVGTVVTEKEVEDLPLDGRNFMELAQVLAGANEGPPNALNSGTRPDDRRATSSLSVNGQDETVNNQLIDGLDNNERVISTIGVRPSVDAIAEFRVQSNLYTAEVGRTAGAVVNIITKTGTNKVHGSVYEFFRNDIFDATDYFALTHTELRQNQYGASVGGPIIHNRLFFFADYEGFRNVRGITQTTSVPTLFEEQNIGNFSDVNKTSVPQASLDQIGVAYFKLYPAPNKPGTANNFTNSPGKVQNSHVGDGRLDYSLPHGDHFFLRYTMNQTWTSAPGIYPVVNGIAAGGNPYAYAGTSDQHAQNAQLNYVHIFSPNVLGEFKFGYTRIDNGSYPLNYGQNLASQFGLVNANLGDLGTSALTPIMPLGWGAVGDGIFLPLRNLDNTFQENGQIVWNHGLHSVKFGAGLIRRQASSQQSPYPAGMIETNTYIQNGISCGALACLLRGIVFVGLRSNQLSVPGFRTWEPSVYAQDDWRVFPRLTLNLGVRYDVFTPFTESHNRLSNFDPVHATLLVAGVNGVGNTAGVQTDYSNIAPRVGFAAVLHEGTVVRGGFGMTYIPVTTGAKTALNNVPYTYNYQSQLNSTTLSQGLPIPTVQSFSDLTSTTIPSFTLAGMDTHFRSTYIEQYNLTLQQQMKKASLTITYVGELGKHLLLNPNVNLTTPGSHSCPSNTASPSSACYQTSLPFYSVFPNLTTARMMVSEGYSNYNSLQVVFSERFSKRLGINANYTWAHGLNDASNYALGSAANGVIPSKISTIDYGDSDLNVSNRFGLLLNYALPFGDRSRGLKRAVIGGWQTNVITVLSTGLPFSIIDGTPFTNTGALGGQERALQVGNPLSPLSVPANSTCTPPSGQVNTLKMYFNPCAFTYQAFGTYNPSHRNALYGPHYRVVNFSLFKTFQVTRKLKLQFRTEAFNVTNTPNFSQPDSEVGDGNFGTISATRQGSVPRQMQFALKLLF